MPRTLRHGAHGDDVELAQKLLNQSLHLVPPLIADGVFGRRTTQAVKRFQGQHQMTTDGVIGPNTWEALRSRKQDDWRIPMQQYTAVADNTRVDHPWRFDVSDFFDEGTTGSSEPAAVTPKAPAPAYQLPLTLTLTEAEKYDLYVRYLQLCPASVTAARQALDAGQRLILGLRVPTNTRSSRGRGTYDDRFVVLWHEAGMKRAREFSGNTDPSARYEDGYEHAKKSYGSDVGGDDRLDLGRVPAGVYRYKKEVHSSYGNALRATDDIVPERDTNHDGSFTPLDRMDPKRLKGNRTFLFHRGWNTMTGSAGCQTMNKPIYDQFWAALGAQEVFYYVLVEARPLPERRMCVG